MKGRGGPDGPEFECASPRPDRGSQTLFAMGLAADMQALGFDCDLAASSQDALLQAMEDAPDIVS